MMQLNLPYLLATAATRRACMVHQRSGVVLCERLGAFRGASGHRRRPCAVCSCRGRLLLCAHTRPCQRILQAFALHPMLALAVKPQPRYRCGLCLALGRNAAMVRGRLFAGQGGGTGACMGIGGD